MFKGLKIKRNFSLANISTFGIGGRGRFLVEVHGADELLRAISEFQGRGEEYRIVAGGSNVIFPDKGLKTALIRIKGGKIRARGGEIAAEAGAELGDLIKKAISLGLSGFESLSGIPGTVGGAIVGNAGAYGRSVSDAVKTVEIWDGRERRWLQARECEFGYRESVFKREPQFAVLRAEFWFGRGEAADLRRKSREIIKTREKKYKPGLLCPGSFFKNVLVRHISRESLLLIDRSKVIDGKIPAGWLLEQVGAKGMSRGKIRIADFHGNLFVNNGNGAACDVKKLAEMLKKKVTKKFGIKLEEEIRYF